MDPQDHVWLHDADSQSLIVFDPDLKETTRFAGKAISLCNYHIIKTTRKMSYSMNHEARVYGIRVKAACS